jgi:hypothetical protein
MLMTVSSAKFVIFGFMLNVPISNMIFLAMCKTYMALYVVKSATQVNYPSSPSQNLEKMINSTLSKSLTHA